MLYKLNEARLETKIDGTRASYRVSEVGRDILWESKHHEVLVIVKRPTDDTYIYLPFLVDRTPAAIECQSFEVTRTKSRWVPYEQEFFHSTDDRALIFSELLNHYGSMDVRVPVGRLVDMEHHFRKSVADDALRYSGGHQGRAADALGLGRTSFQYQLGLAQMPSSHRHINVRVRIGRWDEMISYFLRELIRPIVDLGLSHDDTARRLLVGRSTLEEKMEKLGITWR